MTRVAKILLPIFVSTIAFALAGAEMTVEQLRDADAEMAKMKQEKPEEYRNLVVVA
jgi:hypothetical protein